MPSSLHTEIPPLMPRFLGRRRLGLAAVSELMRECGVKDRIAFLTMNLLRQIAGSNREEAITAARFREYMPYSAVDMITPIVAILRKRGLVQDTEGGFVLTPKAQEVLDRLRVAAAQHVSALKPLPGPDLEKLAYELERAVEGLMDDPVVAPRPGSHLAGSRSIAHLPENPAAMLRIEQAIYDLWMARDDAHMQAWRDAEMQGPAMPIYTLLWNGEADTFTELAEKLHASHTYEDLESNLLFLTEKELVERHGDEIRLTPQGVTVREDIERETDRIYFASWPHTEDEAKWVRDTLQELIDKLPSPTA